MAFNKTAEAKPSRVLGLDLSTKSIAFSLFVDGKLSNWGEFDLRGDSWQRLQLASYYARVIAQKHTPELVAFEAAAYVNNRRTVISLAYVYGAVVSSAMPSPKTPVKEVTAMAWQNAIGNGKLSINEKKHIRDMSPGKSATWYKAAERGYRKQRTMDWVKTTLGVDVNSDNVGDAIAIGWVVSHGKA